MKKPSVFKFNPGTIYNKPIWVPKELKFIFAPQLFGFDENDRILSTMTCLTSTILLYIKYVNDTDGIYIKLNKNLKSQISDTCSIGNMSHDEYIQISKDYPKKYDSYPYKDIRLNCDGKLTYVDFHRIIKKLLVHTKKEHLLNCKKDCYEINSVMTDIYNLNKNIKKDYSTDLINKIKLYWLSTKK